MIRLVVEKTLRVKELWEFAEWPDVDQPLHLQGLQRSKQSIPTLPIVIREWAEGESLEPTLRPRAEMNAERGYWARMMRKFKGH